MVPGSKLKGGFIGNSFSNSWSVGNQTEIARKSDSHPVCGGLKCLLECQQYQAKPKFVLRRTSEFSKSSTNFLDILTGKNPQIRRWSTDITHTSLSFEGSPNNVWDFANDTNSHPSTLIDARCNHMGLSAFNHTLLESLNIHQLHEWCDGDLNLINSCLKTFCKQSCMHFAKMAEAASKNDMHSLSFHSVRV